MRSFIAVTIGVWIMSGTASANEVDIALAANNPLVTVTASGYQSGYNGPTLCCQISNAIDGNPASMWAAQSYAQGGTAWLAVNLGTTFTNIDNIQVQGTGNNLLFSAFEIYVSSGLINPGAPPALANLASPTLVYTQTDQPDGPSLWTDTTPGSLVGTPVQYVLYLALDPSNTEGAICGPSDALAVCNPGTGVLGIGGQEDAQINELVVNVDPPAVPEPATIGLSGGALALLAFVRRRK